MKENEEQSAWSIEIGLYPGVFTRSKNIFR